MSITRVEQYDSQGFVKVDGFCLYAAFAPADDGTASIKIGISTTPLRRIYAVHCGNSDPIAVALWAHVGSKVSALRIERRIHHRLGAYRTRGEWFRMRLDNPEQKVLFHSVCKAAFAVVIGRKLEWRKVTMEQIRQTLGIDGLAVRKKLG